MNGHVVRALTIAGSDSGGGAGIQADLKTMHQFDVYGMSVITAVTAQNTLGVQGIFEMEAGFVKAQLDSVLDDIATDAVKTGMLANESIIYTVADVLRSRGVSRIVVDPVMVAKGGSPLLSSTSVDAMRTGLLPIAEVVTPNLPEASVLCGYDLDSWRDYHKACEDLAAFGAQTVVLKGGHMQSDDKADWPDWAKSVSESVSVDIVFQYGTYTYFLTPRVNSQKTHGTGCTFSAAVASMRARGASVLQSIAMAKAYIFGAIDTAKEWDVGHGHGPTNHSFQITGHWEFEEQGVYQFDGQTWDRLD